MSDIELEQLKSQLLNRDSLHREYMEDWLEVLRYLQSAKENPSEFPVSSKLLNQNLDEAEADPATYLKNLRLNLQSTTTALLSVMIRNNQRIVRLFEMLGNKAT